MFTLRLNHVKQKHVFLLRLFSSKVKLRNSKDNTKAYNSSLENLFPGYSDKTFNPRIKQNGYFYVTDSNTAESIASYVSEDFKDGYVLEANPGPGVLSKALLENGISHLRVFEKISDFLPQLQLISSTYPKMEIVQEDILQLPSFDAKANSNDLFENLFNRISHCSWENGDVPFRFVSIVGNRRSIKFLRYLLAVLPSKSSIFAYGRCEFFLLLSEPEYMYMKAEPKENFAMYRWTTVLYNLFFEIKCLRKFTSESFFPPPPRFSKKRHKKELQYFYLVKLTPKPDVFDIVTSSEKLADLYFFVRHHLVKRTALVIPTIESWIPFCGPKLIKEGMNVFTKFGDLSPNQILFLFNQFSSWPEYEDSTFHSALQRFYNREHFSYEEENANDIT